MPRARRTAAAAAFVGAVALTAATPAVAQQPISESHEAAVLELFELMDLEAQTRAAFEAAFAGGAGGTPQQAAAREAMRDVMVEFHEEYMSWETMRPQYVRMYAEVFTEPEVRELIAFYRTPIGRKLVEATPVVMRRSMEIGQRIMQEHGAELQRMLMERIRARIK